jgi:Domain of unknown function (DUF4321)
MNMKTVLYITLIILFGALLGNFMGRLLGAWFPTGPIHEMFAAQMVTGLKPSTIDLGILNFTFGCMFTLNLTGIIGIIIAAIFTKTLFK